MRSFNLIKLVVYGERSQLPIRLGRVALGTVLVESQRSVIGIGCILELTYMTALTFGAGSLESGCMARVAAIARVSADERERRIGVIESAVSSVAFSSAGRMTRETRAAFVNVSVHSAVLAVGIGLIVFVASETTEHCIIRLVDMAIGASIPLSVMFARINREELRVVVESCRLPSCCIMTSLAIGTESQLRVRRIRGCVISIRMTTVTIGGRGRIIARGVALGTFGSNIIVRAG